MRGQPEVNASGPAGSPFPPVRSDAPVRIGRAGEIPVVEMANIALRYRRSLVAIPLGLAFLVGVFTILTPRDYVATASFMPQANEVSSTASTIARQFGVALPTEQPGQSPEFYDDLLNSRTLLSQALDSEYRIPQPGGGVRTATLLELWTADEGGAPPPWHIAVRRLRNMLSTSVARGTGVIELSVTADNPELATQIVERLLALLNQFNLEVRQSQALEEGRFVAQRVEVAREELLQAERAVEEFLTQNRSFDNSPELRFEYERLQGHLAIRQELYSGLLRSQEEARINAVRDTPVLTVIDQPVARPEERGLVLRVALALFVGLLIAFARALFLGTARTSADADDARYAEFRRLLRESWADLRRPQQWLRRRAP